MEMLNSLLLKLSAFLKGLVPAGSSWGSIHLTHVDLTILLIALALFVVAISVGRSKMLFGLLAIYIAAFLQAHTIGLPLIQDHFASLSKVWFNVLAFFVCYITIFLILNKTASRHRGASSSIPMILVVPFILLELGFILSMFSSELTLAGRDSLVFNILPYFSTQNAHLAWAFAPFVFLLVARLERR